MYGFENHNPACDVSITNLVKMLSVANIPFVIRPFVANGEPRLQVCYPSVEKMQVDAVSNQSSYGGKDGMIEILGAGREGNSWDNPIGFLTAEEAFKIFKLYHEKHQ